MRRQVDLGGDSWSGRVDFRDADLPFVVEIFSRRYHSSLSDIEHDERRLARLRADGFVVVVIWDEQSFSHGYEVSALVRRVRDQLTFGTPANDPWFDFTKTLHLDTADDRSALQALIGVAPTRTGDKTDLEAVDFDPNWGW